MQTHEIIRRFTEHFVDAGHTRVPSASLILDDPTLLFVNAGMVQFKPYFLGEAPPPYPRATSIQKCVRTGDIDEVGKTTRHNTFFQMAGNFSFGDYFKAGAIEHAWNLVTGSQDAGGYGFDPDRIWVTVYQDDDEADRAVAADRRAAGRSASSAATGEDNYWDMGVPGPGGPCSEIYFDRGPEHGREGGPVADEDRYLEIWNLVFMQDVRGELSPKYGHPPIGELPQEEHRHRDGHRAGRHPAAGRGERLRDRPGAPGDRARRGVLRPPLRRRSATDDVRFRVIADHARSGVMIIGDGVTPATRAAATCCAGCCAGSCARPGCSACNEPVLGAFAEVVRDAMAPSYPELATRLRADLRGGPGRGGGLPGHADRRLADLRHRGRRDQAGRPGACCPATRPSSCTTPTASRST